MPPYSDDPPRGQHSARAVIPSWLRRLTAAERCAAAAASSPSAAWTRARPRRGLGLFVAIAAGACAGVRLGEVCLGVGEPPGVEVEFAELAGGPGEGVAVPETTAHCESFAEPLFAVHGPTAAAQDDPEPAQRVHPTDRVRDLVGDLQRTVQHALGVDELPVARVGHAQIGEHCALACPVAVPALNLQAPLQVVHRRRQIALVHLHDGPELPKLTRSAR